MPLKIHENSISPQASLHLVDGMAYYRHELTCAIRTMSLLPLSAKAVRRFLCKPGVAFKHDVVLAHGALHGPTVVASAPVLLLTTSTKKKTLGTGEGGRKFDRHVATHSCGTSESICLAFTLQA